MIAIVGYGQGVSAAVAERFADEGFAVALLARSPERVTAAAAALKAKGVAAAAVTVDAADPEALVAALDRARTALGPVCALHWNAFAAQARDLATADLAALRGDLDVALLGLLSAVQATLPDLRAAGDGAVLVTNGAYGELSTAMDQFAVRSGAMGLALANAAKHKLVGLLNARLKSEGVFVGEVMIAGAVQGTPSDSGSGAIEAARIADTFWRLYRGRDEIFARVS